jgi:hypothetical protein
LALGLAKKGITQPAIELHGRYLIKNQPVNLQNLELIQERWEDLDFSPLPSIDFRNANLLCLRAWRCNFGRMQCDGGNWAQTVFRDCKMSLMDWGSADKGGMMIRYGEKKPIAKALKGPWSLAHTDVVGDMGFSNDKNYIIATNGMLYTSEMALGNYYIWEIETGRGFESTKYTKHLFNINKTTTVKIGLHDKSHSLIYHFDDNRKCRNFMTNKYILISTKFTVTEKNKFQFQLQRGKFLDLSIGSYNCVEAEEKHNLQQHSFALFDTDGNLLDYDDEAADTWLFCLASGRPEPVETALPVD